MNLYRITRSDAGGEEHRGFVVAALSIPDARAVIDGDPHIAALESWSWARAVIECIGTAAPHIARGVLLDDFNGA